MSSQLAIQFEAPPVSVALALGHEGMERAERRAERAAPGFAEGAYRFLCGYAQTHSTPFSSEDAVEVARCIGLIPPDARAWGGVFQRARRAGVIRQSNETYPRRNGHGTRAFKWERA